MAFTPATEQLFKKRLRPLYATAFLQGFVLWYAIEKLFMKKIGFDDAGIGIMIAFYSTIMLIAETPSGILADRWSRKGVLMVASVCLSLSALVAGLSPTPPIYLISSALWGIFFALYSGTYDSIVYDALLEDAKDGERYEHYYGRVSLMDSAGLVLGSLAGGLVANFFGLREAYFLSIPFGLLSLVALWRFNEPQLHKAKVAVPTKQHIKNTFKAVLRRGQLVPIMVVLITAYILQFMLFEFSQVWAIALLAPILWYGPINALLLTTIGISGVTTSHLKLHRWSRMILMLALMLVCGLGLIFSRNLLLTVVSITILCTAILCLKIVFTRLLHDSLASHIRAGAASAVSTLGRIFMVPLALVFGYASRETSIFQAAWILLGILLISVVFVYKSFAKNKELPAIAAPDEVVVETYSK